VPAPAPGLEAAAATPGFVRFCGASATINEGYAVRLAIVRPRDARAGLDLVAFARAPAPDAPLLVATIGEDVDADVEPACIPTSVGCAVLFRTAGGALRFWEGPIERFAPVGAPPPAAADLAGRPYKDHLILSAT
jgi:hypothetical protein